jgi:hypothetical protein
LPAFFYNSIATPIKEDNSEYSHQSDIELGGRDDLTAGYGMETPDTGRTIVIVRRAWLSTRTEMTDYALGNHEQMSVVWASGNDAVVNDMYYQSDVLKYHGHGNRGVAKSVVFDVQSVFRNAS